MNVAVGQQAPGVAPAPALSFERLQLPRDLTRVVLADPALEPALQSLLGDAACAEDGQVDVIVGSREGQAVLLAPCLEQTVRLPVRLGETIIWEQRLPALRLTADAQHGVRSELDALGLLAYVRRAAAGRMLVLSDAATNSPLYRAALNARQADFILTKNHPDAHLFHRFGASYDEFFGQRSSKHRNQLRKKEKVFAERFGADFEFREYRAENEVAQFLAAAKAINRKTYQYRMFGESVDDDATSVASSVRAAAAGCFRSFVLWHGSQPICFVLGNQRADGTFEHRQTGFDPAFRDAAPGITTNILLLQRLYAADRPRIMDFGSGDSDYKRLFSNESRTTANPILLPRHARFMLAYLLYEASARFNHAAVECLERLGVKDWIKRRLRGAT
jgi:hypothetical protein